MKPNEENVIVTKSKSFAIRVMNLRRYFLENKIEYDVSRQLVRSGTSIGANVKEAIRGQSKADFISKMSIALKEASETEYWIELLHDTCYVSDSQYDSMIADCQELIKILISIVKTGNDNR